MNRIKTEVAIRMRSVIYTNGRKTGAHNLKNALRFGSISRVGRVVVVVCVCVSA